MKRCPQCRRDYFDDTLSFCLEDGSPLILGLNSIHSTEPPPFDQPTMIHSTAAPESGSSTAFMPAQAYEPQNENAIAVMPFANMSRDEDAEYLSDGLAEELLNVLSRINGLRVAGRTSAFSFKGKQTTFEEIGRQLHVSSVLEGSVRTAGKRVRISVQLVNVNDGYHLWSQTYDRTMDDIFAIQDDIAASVVEEVRSRLLGKEPDPSLSRQVKVEIADAVKDRAEDPEAHRLMMLGRHYSLRLTAEDLEKAVNHFERVLEIDPQNAQCWIELGSVELSRGGHSFIDPTAGYEHARECAERALSISSDFAGGHALMARVRASLDFDLGGAAESIRKAIELEPRNVSVLLAAGPVMRVLGRFADSAKMYRQVMAVDPLNVAAYRGLAVTLWHAGLLDEAEDSSRKALELWPKNVYTTAQLSLILLDQGRTDEARAVAADEPADVWRSWARAIVENAAGRLDEAEKILAEYIGEHREECAFQIAEIYATMGRADEAFEYIELAVNSHDSGATHIVCSSLLKPLHSDARWHPLLRKIGVPEEYWPRT